MPSHPCENGLTVACFKAYPEWARKALAYKLLHLILPKQISRGLPRMTMPPGYVWRGNWNTWLAWIYAGYDFPWEYFPDDWRIGDVLPPGVVIPPEIEIPPGWPPPPPPPEPPPPEPPWPPIEPPQPPRPRPPPPEPPPPEPPIVKPLEPPIEPPIIVVPPYWPPTRPHIDARPFDIGELLVEQGSNLRALDVGNSMTFFDLGMAIETFMHARIHAIDIKIGRYNVPLDSIGLEIWIANSSYKPVLIVGSGSSNIKKGSGLSEYSTEMDYTRFLFTGTPELAATNKYAIVIGRTGDVWTDRYYQVGEYQFGSKNYHFQLESGTWYIRGTSRLNCRIWGIAL
jgi:hypothetical protein